ncbi:hypothetical protein ITQ95_09395 [Pediococcus pentosaceus]|nr:hypothetical protein [Pediococcus pentosaceus]
MPKRRTVSGLQNQYRFPNDYGASLIYGPGSYGLELAVLDFSVNPDGDLIYNTPITDDVLGYLTWKQVVDVLVGIKRLPSNRMEV